MILRRDIKLEKRIGHHVLIVTWRLFGFPIARLERGL
jgi:hypothetical protein